MLQPLCCSLKPAAAPSSLQAVQVAEPRARHTARPSKLLELLAIAAGNCKRDAGSSDRRGSNVCAHATPTRLERLWIEQRKSAHSHSAATDPDQLAVLPYAAASDAACREGSPRRMPHMMYHAPCCSASCLGAPRLDAIGLAHCTQKTGSWRAFLLPRAPASGLPPAAHRRSPPQQHEAPSQHGRGLVAHRSLHSA